MANSWFQFKQFRVNQGNTAMKVGTDGVLLGAWADASDCSNILDIGTGTGLISLMIAQRNINATITGIDIDENAAQQALENFQDSPWTGRLEAVHSSLQDFGHQSESSFDLIVCNPPFFKQAYKGPDKQRNTARHNDVLSFDDLAEWVSRLISPNGHFCVVIPFNLEKEFISVLLSKDFNLSRILHVKPTPQKGIARSLLEFSKKKIDFVKKDCLIIEDKGRHGYSETYKTLTKGYYLAF